MTTTGSPSPPSTRRMRALLRALADAARGALVGVTEIVPGVSGGTVALIIGVYDTLIDGAGHLARAAARALTDGLRGRGLGRAREHVRAVRWPVVLPVGIGMLIAIFVGARLLSPVIAEHPNGTRAVFAGLIAASLIVPARMTGARWRWQDALVAVAAATAVFFLIGIPAQASSVDPPLLLVGAGAAVAVCALVLPGVSGSYLLLTLGLYAPTLAALNGFDLLFIATFMLGGILGLGLFVPVLQWLLAHRRRITLVVMTGLMAGSLRAVWPWQTEDAELLAPAADWPVMLGLFAVGVAAVACILTAEAVLIKRQLESRAVGTTIDIDAATTEKEHELGSTGDRAHSD